MRIILLLLLLPVIGAAQKGFLLRGDTLFHNDGEGNEKQLTKLVPSMTGQSGNILSTNGTTYTWVTPSAGDWSAITGKPSTFTPATHSHAISDVTALQAAIDAKQATLVSGSNIKTINNQSLLGSENINITGSGYDPTTGPIFFTEFVTVATTLNAPFTGTAISSGTNALNNTNMTVQRPGVTRMTSSTTANGGFRWQTDVTTIRLKGNEMFECAIAPVNFTTTTMRAGFHDATSITDAVDGAYFEYNNSGVIVLKTSNNSTRTTSATITTLSLNTWYKLRITVNADATSVLGEVFDANGTLINSVSNTTNIPTASGRECGAGIICTESTTTATAMCDLDYLKFVNTLSR